MMKYTTPPPRTHAHKHARFFMVVCISNTEKIIFTEPELHARITRTHTGSHLVCVHGLDEHSLLLKERK